MLNPKSNPIDFGLNNTKVQLTDMLLYLAREVTIRINTVRGVITNLRTRFKA